MDQQQQGGGVCYTPGQLALYVYFPQLFPPSGPWDGLDALYETTLKASDAECERFCNTYLDPIWARAVTLWATCMRGLHYSPRVLFEFLSTEKDGKPLHEFIKTWCIANDDYTAQQRHDPKYTPWHPNAFADFAQPPPTPTPTSVPAPVAESAASIPAAPAAPVAPMPAPTPPSTPRVEPSAPPALSPCDSIVSVSSTSTPQTPPLTPQRKSTRPRTRTSKTTEQQQQQRPKRRERSVAGPPRKRGRRFYIGPVVEPEVLEPEVLEPALQDDDVFDIDMIEELLGPEADPRLWDWDV